MSFKEEKKKRDALLFAIYKASKAARPSDPTSARIGFSKTRPYSLKLGKFLDNDDERGGYILGEQLGLSIEEVDGFINILAGSQYSYLDLSIGNMLGNITERGIRYLESLEEEPILPVQIRHTNIHINNVNAPLQFQNDVSHSSQSQEISYSNEDIQTVFALIKKDIENSSAEIKEELSTEMEYALKQMQKNKPAKQQLQNIGAILSNLGVGTMGSLIASPIWEVIKPVFGFH